MDKIQEKAISLALRGHNILLTGFPGTGKSFTIVDIANQLKAKEKNVAVTATTGIASQNLKSKLPDNFGPVSTIHKFVGLKDGRYENEELLNLILHDENFVSTLNNLKKVDVVIIDEISMLSCKQLAQIHFIFQSVRHSTCPFGGVQVIVSGDFYQLPPVPNINYGDEGRMCFHSSIIKEFFHHVQLDTIHRQEEPDFISALHQIASGNVSEETGNLFKRLKRTLPPGPDPVNLFAENFDVEMWNSDRLLEADGDIMLYKSEESGSKKHLETIPVPKVLALKVNCPVMLTVNLSDELVNGLTGKVIELQDNAVQVYFNSINKQCKISPFSFTVYDKQKQADVACRRQIPLKLSYALTVHKAQGLSLSRVSINCKKMNQDGQLYVALSRGTCKKGLQVLNFNPKLVKKPTETILDFHALPQKFPSQNLLCCNQNNFEVVQLDVHFESEFSCLFDSDNEPYDAIVAEDEELDRCVSFMEAYEEGNILHELPEDVTVQEILNKVKPKFTVTVQQKAECAVVENMHKSEYTVKLFQYLWNAFMTIKENVLTEGKITNKSTSDFYRRVNQVLIDAKMDNIVNVFEGDPTSRKNVVFKVSQEIRNLVLELSVSEIRQKAKERDVTERPSEFPESSGGRGKIRYLGGWCVRKVKQIKKKQLVKNLYKENKNDSNLAVRRQLNLLEQLETTEYELLQTSEHRESLDETIRKQNIRKGLTNISDKSFNYFLLLDKKIRALETTANIDYHGTNVHSFILAQLKEDLELENKFNSQFSAEISNEDMKSLHNDVLSKYSMMSLFQLRKTYLREKKLQKTEAHRKQIKMREKSGRTDKLFNFNSFKEDKSEGKIVSHLRIQSEVIKTENFLSNTFTKAQLQKICMAYDCPVDIKKSKKIISDNLKKVMSTAQGIVNASAFTDAIITATLEVEPAASTSIEPVASISAEPVASTSIEPVAGTSIEPVAGTSIEPIAGTSMEPIEGISMEPIAGTNLALTANEHDEDVQLKSVRGKKRQCGTKKGKKQKKKKTIVKYPCGICKRECENNYSVGCDGCDGWFHADCLRIDNLEELPDEWFCNECINLQ